MWKRNLNCIYVDLKFIIIIGPLNEKAHSYNVVFSV